MHKSVEKNYDSVQRATNGNQKNLTKPIGKHQKHTKKTSRNLGQMGQDPPEPKKSQSAKGNNIAETRENSTPKNPDFEDDNPQMQTQARNI